MTFLLDTNVLLDFQNAELLPSLVHAAQTLDMAVAEKVFDEVTLPKAARAASHGAVPSWWQSWLAAR